MTTRVRLMDPAKRRKIYADLARAIVEDARGSF